MMSEQDSRFISLINTLTLPDRVLAARPHECHHPQISARRYHSGIALNMQNLPPATVEFVGKYPISKSLHDPIIIQFDDEIGQNPQIPCVQQQYIIGNFEESDQMLSVGMYVLIGNSIDGVTQMDHFPRRITYEYGEITNYELTGNDSLRNEIKLAFELALSLRQLNVQGIEYSYNMDGTPDCARVNKKKDKERWEKVHENPCAKIFRNALVSISDGLIRSRTRLQPVTAKGSV